MLNTFSTTLHTFSFLYSLSRSFLCSFPLNRESSMRPLRNSGVQIRLWLLQQCQQLPVRLLQHPDSFPYAWRCIPRAHAHSEKAQASSHLSRAWSRDWQLLESEPSALPKGSMTCRKNIDKSERIRAFKANSGRCLVSRRYSRWDLASQG